MWLDMATDTIRRIRTAANPDRNARAALNLAIVRAIAKAHAIVAAEQKRAEQTKVDA